MCLLYDILCMYVCVLLLVRWWNNKETCAIWFPSGVSESSFKQLLRTQQGIWDAAGVLLSHTNSSAVPLVCCLQWIQVLVCSCSHAGDPCSLNNWAELILCSHRTGASVDGISVPSGAFSSFFLILTFSHLNFCSHSSGLAIWGKACQSKFWMDISYKCFKQQKWQLAM